MQLFMDIVVDSYSPTLLSLSMICRLYSIVSPIMIYTRLMVKLVSVIANHKVMINQAFECIFLNWQDYISLV